ncbi:hypothetical protein CKO15_01040 [Halorhodospira abdelmalekii]|uniref:hypothetical protein n=1 Tax=Halorhodospira abdelmalekii TaxID=421629 RepID=UPI001908EB8D|nr:hypothetical protein [Halorhodospira abdelmalekii]MBK1733886.1 hypothetical protein [Halorhodospira abdelmalekii]
MIDRVSGKSYRLLHYLNRPHSIIERAALALIGFTGCLAITASPTLARQLAGEFWQDDFKESLRRAHWYATRGWPRIGRVDSDPFFCVSDGLSLTESKALLRWVDQRARRSRRLPETEARCARLCTLAQCVHRATLAGHVDCAQERLVEFWDDTDDLLARLSAWRERLGERCGPPGSRPPGPPRTGDFARDDAEAALHDVAHLLPLERWRWMALTGTFLGLYREGDFLPHDFDIDLGLLACEVDLAALRQRLERSPRFVSVRSDEQYRLHRTSAGLGIERLPVLIKAVHRTGIAVDFSLLHQEEGVWWHGSTLHRWEHAPMERIEYELRGVKILGPRAGDRYLSEAYGDWRTPRHSFNCTSDSHNLVVVRNLLSVSLSLKRLAWHLSQDDAEGYDALLEQLLRQGLLYSTYGAYSTYKAQQNAPIQVNRNWLDD